MAGKVGLLLWKMRTNKWKSFTRGIITQIKIVARPQATILTAI